MSLGEWMLHSALAERTVAVGLARGGREVVSPGYRRVAVAPADWNVVGGSATALVKFGPFTVPVVFNQLLVFDGADLITTIPKGTTQLSDGTYEADLTLGATDA